jgi:hypothetical protein
MKTDPSAQPAPRPVSLMAVIAVFMLLSAFGYLAERIYFPGISAAPQNEVPDNLSKDLAWKATPKTRRDAMLDLKQEAGRPGRSLRLGRPEGRHRPAPDRPRDGAHRPGKMGVQMSQKPEYTPVDEASSWPVLFLLAFPAPYG